MSSSIRRSCCAKPSPATALNGLLMQPLLLDCAVRRARNHHRRGNGRDQPDDKQHVVLASARRRNAGGNLRHVAYDPSVVRINYYGREHADAGDEKVSQSDEAVAE